MSIYRKAVNNPVTTALVFAACAILGIFSLMRISIDQLPEFDANVIMVMSSYPGASAEDIETNLSKVLENALNGVSDLKDITSQSKENICLIMLEFEWGVDIDVATNDVRDKLDLVNSELPDGATIPVIFKFSADDLPIMILSATAGESLPALEKILDDKVTTPLARVSGVGTVSVTGAPQREIQVFCDPGKLEAYGLSITTISGILASENRNVPSGSIDIGSDTYSVRVEKEFENAEEMLDIVVGYSAGQAVYLRDVARVTDGQEERAQEAYTDGVQGAQIVIQKQTGANSVDVINGVKKALAQIQQTLPSDVKITTVIDNSRNIINSIDSLKETLVITFLVVMLVVYVFLGRWRATFIIVLAIPISLLASLVYLFATGNTLNVISLSALSIAIGMVVDDAIVVLENITTHLERGEKPKEAAVHATQEVGISVIASTLTMLAVFFPLTLIQGISGVMFKQLGWIVCIIMIVSTVGAITLVPMLCSRFLVLKPKTGKLHRAVFGPVNRFIDWITRGYGHIIAWSVKHRTVVVCTALVIFLSTLAVLGPMVKSEYFPKSDSGRISATVELPVGTAQHITREFAEDLYSRFMSEIPEMEVCSYTLGQADTDNAWGSMQNTGTHIISFSFNIGSMELRERSCTEIADIIRSDLDSYPEIKKYEVTEGEGGMGGQSSVDIEIYGYDFSSTDRLAEVIAEKMKAEGNASQVTISRDEYTPEYEVDFDRTKLAVNGLNSTTAASYVNAAINGSTQSFYREDGDEYNIRVRYAPEFRTSVEDIENIMVYSPAGMGIRVKDLGAVVEDMTPPTIERKNRERTVTVNAVVGNGYALSDVYASAQKVIRETEIPSELSVVIAGDIEDQQDTFSDLILLLILILMLVYIVMAAQFESLRYPFIIMFSVPFAFVGLVLSLVITNETVNLMSMIGAVMLVGIVVKNGIVLVDYINLNRERGMSISQSVISGGKSRLRPVLMTSATTVLGMVPMAMGIGEGSELWQPMGIAIVGGLTVSTLVTLVIIPVMYCVFASREVVKYRNKHSLKLNRRTV